MNNIEAEIHFLNRSLELKEADMEKTRALIREKTKLLLTFMGDSDEI